MKIKNLGERSVGLPKDVKGGGVPLQNDLIFNNLRAVLFLMEIRVTLWK